MKRGRKPDGVTNAGNGIGAVLGESGTGIMPSVDSIHAPVTVSLNTVVSNGSVAGAGGGGDYFTFVSKFTTQKGERFSHTRIPDRSLSIGGAFMIPKAELPEFYRRYYQHVFGAKKQEYLTEKQQESNGPCLVDFDFRYASEIEDRQHEKSHIVDMVAVYMDIINKVYDFTSADAHSNEPDVSSSEIPFYIFEKSAVNMQADITKDGIHMIIGMKMDRAVQMLIREEALHELPEIWGDLPLTNTWTQVYDEGIVKGCTNWQLYGSRKPNHKAYELTYIFVMTRQNGEWHCREKRAADFDLARDFCKLSAQYEGHCSFPIASMPTTSADTQSPQSPNIEILKRLEVIRASLAHAQSAASRKPSSGYEARGGGGRSIVMHLEDSSTGVGSQQRAIWAIDEIKTARDLRDAVDQMLLSLDAKEYELRETHEYVMTLPPQYYENYTQWLHVGFALNNTSQRLFLSWMLFSSQWPRFSFADIPKHLTMWRGFSYNPSGLTNRSIRYWARRDALVKYNDVHDRSIDHYIEETIRTEQSTDFDLAMVLFHVFKERFVCASVSKNIWYEFINHRWSECDEGNTLRLLISRDMYRIYYNKLQLLMDELRKYETGSEQFVHIKKLTEKITAVNVKLKTTTYKNNIMREVKTLFYEKKFYDNLNANPYLLCFTNGVMDFKQKCFRDGQPDDNISKCTNTEYLKMDDDGKGAKCTHSKEIAEITEFMEQLFPLENVRRYMWEHLASVLIGVNRDQTFNVYIGGGSNGKSKLVELMAMCLGDYKVSLPIALITQKRIGIGSTSSEIAQLVGVRYAVMQEPTKSDNTLNDGVLKEITGGDPITARALYKDSITFIPQCKLAVCTNVMFNLEANDDGTKRRIKKIDFVSKFCERPSKDDPDSPHQFMINKYLDERLRQWAHVFMSMLVEKALQTGGVVKTCKEVEDSSNAYFESEDHISEFISDKVQPFEGGMIRSGDLNETFKKWYRNQHDKDVPKPKELYAVMDKRYGKRGALKMWKNVCIIQDDEYAKDETFEGIAAETGGN
jgi:P4 family phage/plasmid primase-like protien